MSDIHLASYLNDLLDVLQRELANNLHGVYLFGSAGSGAYEPGCSDVDVYAVIHRPELATNYYAELARKLSHHGSLSCPARKLEFVLFTKANAAAQTSHPRFELNFNTGRDMDTDYVNTDPAAEPDFWFLLDIASGRERGTALHGPPPAEVFAAPKIEWILDCIVESLDWHRRSGPVTSDGILNSCRALRFAKTGQWGSKREGGNWAIGYYMKPDIVALALDARLSKAELPQNDAIDFLDRVQLEVEQCRVGI
ncbi:hypothetical protein BJX65DRAFT_316123 [Aspergillus insuetus]